MARSRSACGRGASVHARAHWPLGRAARRLGFRPGQLRVLPAGADLRLDARTLAEAISFDVEAGRAPLFVSVSAGATNTGTIDPLTGEAELTATMRFVVEIPAISTTCTSAEYEVDFVSSEPFAPLPFDASAD